MNSAKDGFVGEGKGGGKTPGGRHVFLLLRMGGAYAAKGAVKVELLSGA